MRSVHPDKRPRALWWVLVKWAAVLGFIGALVLAATVAFVFWMYGRDPSLPSEKTLAGYSMKQVITVLDTNGQRVGEIFGPDKTIERRTYVPYDKIPRPVVDAFVAAEDNRFWTHGGVDYWGMFRALVANARGKRQGASTITQQVVKRMLLTPERTFKRKVQEIILARRVEHSLKKEEIMALYLNQIYFGNNRYGIEEAAKFYFGKDVSELNPGEAATLASIPQRPDELSRDKPKNRLALKVRQTYVLNQLREMNKLTPEESQKWINDSIHIVKPADAPSDSAPEWVARAREELVAQLKAAGKDETALDTLGGTVRTTLDPGLQQTAQAALQKALRGVDRRHGIARPVRHVKPGQVDAEIDRLGKRFPGTPIRRDRYDAVVTGVYDEDHEIAVDFGGYKASIELDDETDARYNPPDDAGKRKKPSERFEVGDVVDATSAGGNALKHAEHRAMFAPGPQGAVVVIDVRTRKVRALVGGYNTRVGGLDRATQAKRQPGSSFKTFVYATGIASRKFTAATRVNDAPDVLNLWKPKNYDKKFVGPVLVRYALSKSINTIAIRITHDVTPEAVVATAKAMGIQSELAPDISISLGSHEVTPLEMTNAVASFATGGIYAPPRFVEAIGGKDVPAVPGVRAMPEDVAYITTSMMQTVVQSGTGHLAQALKVPIAGKTGTSNDARDAWFVGLTPDYAIGVWIGYDDPREMGKETGGTTAVPVFVDVARTMNLPAKQFPRPATIVEAKIDRTNGLLAPEGAPPASVMTEVFLQGTVPTEVAPLPDEVTAGTATASEYDLPTAKPDDKPEDDRD